MPSWTTNFQTVSKFGRPRFAEGWRIPGTSFCNEMVSRESQPEASKSTQEKRLSQTCEWCRVGASLAVMILWCSGLDQEDVCASPVSLAALPAESNLAPAHRADDVGHPLYGSGGVGDTNITLHNSRSTAAVCCVHAVVAFGRCGVASSGYPAAGKWSGAAARGRSRSAVAAGRPRAATRVASTFRGFHEKENGLIMSLISLDRTRSTEDVFFKLLEKDQEVSQ